MIRSLALALAVPAVLLVQTPSGGPAASGVKVETLATLEFPWGMAYLPDGRLLVTEKPGRLRIFAGGKLSAPVTGLPKVSYRGPKDQGGLMDVAVDPGFSRNGLVYVSYTEADDAPPQRDNGDPRFGNFLPPSDEPLRGGAVARGRLDGNALRDVQVIWRQVPKTVGRGHFGVRIVVAPDGTLFLTSGERMRFDPAQDLQSNLGKVVHVNADGSAVAGGAAGARSDVYSVGHRNMLAAAVQPGTNDLWVVEMGPLGGDELNLVKAGRNYGWPVVSNGDNYDRSDIPDHPTKPSFEAPVKTWTPVVSPSGMLFYGGAMFPAWRGQALVGGLSSKAILRLALKDGKLAGEERIDMQKRIRDVIEAPDGAILAIVDDAKGELLRLTPAAR